MTVTEDGMPTLYVGDAAREMKVPGTGAFTIGRDGDFPVGEDNPHMHRRMLEIRAMDGRWLLTNLSRYYPVNLIVQERGVTEVVHRLVPHGCVYVRWSEFAIIIVIREVTYSLDVYCENLARERAGFGGKVTLDVEPLADSERMLIAALAEDVFSSGNYGEIRKNEEARRALGWQGSPKKFDRRLDKLCEKLAARDVPGITREDGTLSSQRRTAAVQYCLESGLVTAADMALVRRERRDQESGEG